MKGKTKTGFEFDINDRILNDMELIDALAAMQGENPLAVSLAVEKMLGSEQRKKLYDHVRDEENIVSADLVGEELSDMLEQLGNEGKN